MVYLFIYQSLISALVFSSDSILSEIYFQGDRKYEFCSKYLWCSLHCWYSPDPVTIYDGRERNKSLEIATLLMNIRMM